MKNTRKNNNGSTLLDDTAAMFTDVRFMSAEDKKNVFSAWKRFLRTLATSYSDKEKCFRAFTKALHGHLIQHCSFIAHYNRRGFFSTYFEYGDDTVRFIKQFDRRQNPDGLSVEYGASWVYGDYQDINEAMCSVAEDYVDDIYRLASGSQKQQDIDAAKLLLAKHNVTVTFPSDPNLLEACIFALDELHCPDGDDDECGAIAALRDAVKKARGHQNGVIAESDSPSDGNTGNVFRISSEDLQICAEQKIGRRLSEEELHSASKAFEWGMESWSEVAGLAVDSAVEEHSEDA